MRLTKSWLENHRAELPAMNAAIDIAGDQGISNDEKIRRMKAHPYYNHFKKSCFTGFRIDEESAKDLWVLLMEGYYRQNQVVAGLAQELEQKLAEGKKVTMIDYLNKLNQNEDFIEFVEQISRHRGLSTNGKELALWTGGYAVSLEVRKLGFCTLEGTVFGGILDTLPITDRWECEIALWNLLSKKFVEEYTGSTVHIYFRNVDELCVLFCQEIPMLAEKSGINVIWHPLITRSGDKLEEVGYIKSNKTFPHISVKKDNRVFVQSSQTLLHTTESFLPFEALEGGVKTSSPKSNRMVYETFRSRTFCPNRPPFAVDETRTYGRTLDDDLQRFWN